jgi:hypothetical protein
MIVFTGSRRNADTSAKVKIIVLSEWIYFLLRKVDFVLSDDDSDTKIRSFPSEYTHQASTTCQHEYSDYSSEYSQKFTGV